MEPENGEQQDPVAVIQEELLQKVEELSGQQLKALFTTKLAYFCEHLNNEEVMNMLQEQNIFTSYIVADIKTEKEQSAQNIKLFGELMKRPKEDLLKFINILIRTNQRHIAEILVA